MNASLAKANTAVQDITINGATVNVTKAGTTADLTLDGTTLKTKGYIGGTADSPTYAAGSTIESILSGLDSRIVTATNGGITSVSLNGSAQTVEANTAKIIANAENLPMSSTDVTTISAAIADAKKTATDEVTRAKAAEQANTDNIKKNTDAISILNGTGVGSVSKAVSDAKTEVIGTAADASTADTVKGAKAYADAIVANANKGTTDAIAALDVADSAAANQYVSSVSQQDGKIAVTREKLPVISVTDTAAEGQFVTGISLENGAVKASRSAINDTAIVSVPGTDGTGLSETATTVNAALKELNSKIKSADDAGKVTVSTANTTDGYLKSYTFSQNSTIIGTIDIPKDLVVSKGEIVTVNKVKYLRLTIANQANPVDIAVSDLVDVYTGADATEGIKVNIDDTNKISATVLTLDGSKLVAKSVTKDALSDAVQTSLGKADSAVQSVNGVAGNTVKIDAADIQMDKASVDAQPTTVKSEITAIKQELANTAAATDVVKNVTVNGKDAAVADNKATVTIAASDISTGTVTASTAALAAGDSVNDTLSKLYGQINKNKVVAGNGISVTEGDNTTVAVKLDTVKTDNALSVSENGLYLSNVWDCGTF